MQFVLQTGTPLHETDDTFAFAMRGDDLVAIKKSGTGTNSTEVHVLSGASNYQTFVLQTGTPLHETDDTFAFAMRGDDLVAIKKSGTGTNSTEVHVLSGASNYQTFVLQTGTPLHETDDTFAFAMRGDDLVAIKKSGTGTNSTEVHVLSGASNYQTFVLQTGTPLHETDDTFAFAMRGDDLVAIKKSGTGTNSTEVHVLSGASNYQTFVLQTGTPLHETDDTFAFAMRGDDLVAIKKSGTGTNSTEVHQLDLSLYVRNDVATLPAQGLPAPWDPVTLGFARAVEVMRARPSSDPTSWAYQRAMHATTEVPVSQLWNGCQHHKWHFFPWHRMFLYYFERIVRAAVIATGGPSDWALPYWNPYAGTPRNTLPAAFTTPTLPQPGNPANPLLMAGRTMVAGTTLIADPNDPRSITLPYAAALARTNFAAAAGFPSFGGSRVQPSLWGPPIDEGLSEIAHDVIHGAVGGAMGLVRDAALDPIFWLHHANIDRLWDEWLQLGTGRANPSDAAWLDQEFEFFDYDGSVVKLSGKDVVDHAHQLGYIYG